MHWKAGMSLSLTSAIIRMHGVFIDILLEIALEVYKPFVHIEH
jgi:hypothetical protein